MSPIRRRASAPSIDRDLGELFARVELLAGDFRQERDKQSEFRRQFHTVSESLAESVRVLTEFMRENQPLLEQYRELRAEARGAARVKKWALGVIVSASTVAGALINEIWKAFTRGGWPHP